jgi:hypothetical protein
LALHYALAYVAALGIQELLGRYAFAARAVWLSERGETEKLDLLLEMSDLVRQFFFSAWWRAAQIIDRKKKLVAVLERANRNPELPAGE